MQQPTVYGIDFCTMCCTQSIELEQESGQGIWGQPDILVHWYLNLFLSPFQAWKRQCKTPAKNSIGTERQVSEPVNRRGSPKLKFVFIPDLSVFKNQTQTNKQTKKIELGLSTSQTASQPAVQMLTLQLVTRWRYILLTFVTQSLACDYYHYKLYKCSLCILYCKPYLQSYSRVEYDL